MEWLLTYKDENGKVDYIKDFDYYEQAIYFANVNGYEIIKIEELNND